jgi:hypothetical protein
MNGVRKTYPFFTLEDIDLDLPASHVMGFIGPDGFVYLLLEHASGSRILRLVPANL